MAMLKYTRNVINQVNQWSQATRPKNIGQMSELFPKFILETDGHSMSDFKEWFYKNHDGEKKIKRGVVMNRRILDEVIKNLQQITDDDLEEWGIDLVINKTYNGLNAQYRALKLASNGKPYRIATPDEESKGIDGFIGDEPVSVKPKSYKATINRGVEEIPYRIIYYTEDSGVFQLIDEA